MATRRAVANGNWSATGTWQGGVVPGNGDTVYASGFNVTLDTDITIGGGNNPTVSAGSFVAGQWYEITFVGTTSWTSIGAASNTLGVVFLATGVGSGTGEAKALATLTTAANTAAGAAAGGSFVMSTVRAMTCDLRAGTTTCLNVTATTGTLTLSGIRAVGGSAAGAHAINTNSTITIEFSEVTLTGGTNSHAMNNNGSGIISFIGSSVLVGGSGGNGYAINNASAGTINLSSVCAVSGGAAGVNSFCINNASTGTINVSASCTFVGGNTGGNALNNASTGTINVSASCTFTGSASTLAYPLNNASTGSVTVTNSTFTASAFANAVNIANTGADVRLSGDFLDHWSGWKAVSGGKWRLGTAPTLGQTRYALAGTTDSYFTEFGSDYGSFGNPIAANVRSGIVYGGGNLTGTCAVPAAGSVALGVPVDATTGTAVLDPAAVASAVWGAATRTITGGTVDTLTNAPTVPSAVAIASQVRTELTSELSKISALNTTRLGQVATTEIVGNLLAQANS